MRGLTVFGRMMLPSGPRKWTLDIGPITCEVAPWNLTKLQAFVDNRMVIHNVTAKGCSVAIERELRDIRHAISEAEGKVSKPIESALKPGVEEAWLTLVNWLMRQRPGKARTEIAAALDVIRKEMESR